MSQLFRMTAGTRVRRFMGGVCRHGTVQDIALVGPWIRVLFDGDKWAIPLLAGEVQEPLPAGHTHACCVCRKRGACSNGAECPEPDTHGYCSQECENSEIPF